MALRVKQKGDVLRIELPLEKPRPSTSGKSMLVASTHGVKTTEVFYEGTRIVVNASAFIYPKEKDKK
jgi:hypothetical protein